ncbi:MAG: aldehyde dehydrogenase [Chloroflexi bacterium]|jgi:acyl-CoA reductase-like NAD-dependent aldehyde dehydrogenase|nr:aldehyde dehydrogenase [Chloroflexota bacterium]
MYINGKFTNGNSVERIPIINPATEEAFADSARGTIEDAFVAVAAAKVAFQEWKRTPANERAAALHAVAAKIREHHDEIVHLLTLEEGKPIPENDEELWWVEETFDYYAELARHERGRVIPPGDPGQFNFVIKEPYGVVGCIVPWNYPLLLLAWKMAPALAAGNTVVIKPSELTPLATLKLVEVACDHLPPGVVNVVTGYGPEVGEPLVTHPDVPVIAFTGSLAVGQRIATLAGPMMKKLHLELGGKDPMVIAPDAEMDMAVSGLAYAALINTGQVCTSTERVYVHESIFGQFSEELVDFVGKLRIGNGMDKGVDIGPMIRNRFREKVEGQLAEAQAAGANILIGGQRPAQFSRGFFLAPAVVTGVDHSMRLMREETFGPVIPLMPYKDFDEAIALANDCQYGLGATLMSRDARLVKRFFDEVKGGTIWINDPLTDNFAGPFGGMKMSGLGRELGQEGLDEYYDVKHVHWDIEGGVKDYWYPY